MPPRLSWPDFALALDALEAAPDPPGLNNAVRPLMKGLGATLLGVATNVSAADEGPHLQLALVLDPGAGALNPEVRTKVAAAAMQVAASRSGPFRLSETEGLDELEDAFCIPRLGPAGREVAILAGRSLVLHDGSDRLAARILIEAVADRLAQWRVHAQPKPGLLTQRQKDCLAAALRGANSIQIGVQLRLSPKTVDAYIAAAAERLGACNRTAAVGLAVQRGLIG